MYEIGRVLFLDEDKILVSNLRKKLRKHGLRCCWVSTVASALRKMRHFRPDFVVMDVGLQGINGTAFLACAKKWFPSDYPPPQTIVFSHIMEPEIVEYVKALGAMEYLNKIYGIYPLITFLKRQLAITTNPPLSDLTVPELSLA